MNIVQALNKVKFDILNFVTNNLKNKLGNSGNQTLTDGSFNIADTNNTGCNIEMTRTIDSVDYELSMQPTKDTASFNYYQGSTLANNMQLHSEYTSFKKPVSVSAGGTGATTAAGALNKLGLTATATELNYMDGVTSNVQTQLNNKASSSHNHSASDITTGTLPSSRLPTVPISKGGTGATNGAVGLSNLFASGETILSTNQYGTSLPTAGTNGRIFFKKV